MTNHHVTMQRAQEQRPPMQTYYPGHTLRKSVSMNWYALNPHLYQAGWVEKQSKSKPYFTWATEKAIQILAALSTKEGETDGGTENDKQTGA